MVELTFLDNLRRNIIVYIILIVVGIFLLFMVFPWKAALILTLWGGYVLWWPTIWLEKYIHRRYLAALIVIIVTGVLLAGSLVIITVIVAQQLAQLAAGAANSNATLSAGLTSGVHGVSPGLEKVGAIGTFISALASGGGIITETFTGVARDVAQQILRAIPVLLIQLVIVFFLLLGILGRGDIIVNDFKSAAPLKYRPTVNRFLDHLNKIYFSFFFIYVAVAILCGILAAIVYGLIGVPFFLTFAVILVFVGLIPSIGRALIYIPLSIWLILSGNTITGLIVLIFSIVVFELILRYTLQPRLMERTGRVPRPLSLIAFTFALAAFGPLGFAIGPAIVGFALAMWRTYRDVQKEQEAQMTTLEQSGGEPSGIA